MFGQTLYIRKITKHLDRNGNTYYKLVLNKISIIESEYSYGDNLFLTVDEEDYNLTVFSNSGYGVAWFFCDIDQDNPEIYNRDMECAIDSRGNFLDIDFNYIVTERLHLFKALDSGAFREGYWLCGQIIKRRVRPYTINGSNAKHYTLPIIWDDVNLTGGQKQEKIVREFNWKGRVIVQGTDEDWFEEKGNVEDKDYRNSWDGVTNADAFDDPSDYWNID